MAAYLFQFNPLCKNLLGNIFKQTIDQVRNASKKKGGTARLKKACGGKPGHFGLRRGDGTTVKAGTVIAKQLKLNLCPGLNVGVGRIAKLYAKVPGKVVITCEKTNLDPDNYLVKFKHPNHLPIYKKYINVIPEPQHQIYKLVETF